MAEVASHSRRVAEKPVRKLSVQNSHGIVDLFAPALKLTAGGPARHFADPGVPAERRSPRADLPANAMRPLPEPNANPKARHVGNSCRTAFKVDPGIPSKRCPTLSHVAARG